MLVGNRVVELSLLASTKARLSSNVLCTRMLLCRWLASTGSASCAVVHQMSSLCQEGHYVSTVAPYPCAGLGRTACSEASTFKAFQTSSVVK